jgi:hypothetical protein
MREARQTARTARPIDKKIMIHQAVDMMKPCGKMYILSSASGAPAAQTAAVSIVSMLSRERIARDSQKAASSYFSLFTFYCSINYPPPPRNKCF